MCYRETGVGHDLWVLHVVTELHNFFIGEKRLTHQHPNARTHTLLHTNIHTHTRARTHTHTSIHTHTLSHTRSRAHAHTHTHTHIHTHSLTQIQTIEIIKFYFNSSLIYGPPTAT